MASGTESVVKFAATAALLTAVTAVAPAHAARVQTAREGQLRASYTFPPNNSGRGGRLEISNRGRLIVSRHAYTHDAGRGRVLSTQQLDEIGTRKTATDLWWQPDYMGSLRELLRHGGYLK